MSSHPLSDGWAGGGRGDGRKCEEEKREDSRCLKRRSRKYLKLLPVLLVVVMIFVPKADGRVIGLLQHPRLQHHCDDDGDGGTWWQGIRLVTNEGGGGMGGRIKCTPSTRLGPHTGLAAGYEGI